MGARAWPHAKNVLFKYIWGLGFLESWITQEKLYGDILRVLSFSFFLEQQLVTSWRNIVDCWFSSLGQTGSDPSCQHKASVCDNLRLTLNDQLCFSRKLHLFASTLFYFEATEMFCALRIFIRPFHWALLNCSFKLHTKKCIIRCSKALELSHFCLLSWNQHSYSHLVCHLLRNLSWREGLHLFSQHFPGIKQVSLLRTRKTKRVDDLTSVLRGLSWILFSEIRLGVFCLQTQPSSQTSCQQKMLFTTVTSKKAGGRRGDNNDRETKQKHSLSGCAWTCCVQTQSDKKEAKSGVGPVDVVMFGDRKGQRAHAHTHTHTHTGAYVILWHRSQTWQPELNLSSNLKAAWWCTGLILCYPKPKVPGPLHSVNSRQEYVMAKGFFFFSFLFFSAHARHVGAADCSHHNTP